MLAQYISKDNSRYTRAGERGHLLGGVAGLVIIGVALIALAPAKQSGKRASAAAA